MPKNRLLRYMYMTKLLDFGVVLTVKADMFLFKCLETVL